MSKTAALAALATAALTLGIAAPATAATLRVHDPQDTSHGSDLRSVKVRHGDRNVVVTTRHTDLRPAPRTGSGGAVYLDIDPTTSGPDFVLVGGFFRGTDYQLLHTDGFGSKRWGTPVRGSYDMTVDYAREQVRIRAARRTLGDPERVRVAVRVSGTRSDGTSAGLVDWLGEPRSLTDWVPRG